ncbi:MAG: D-alanine--D-alanine ligase [Firmicutes bacterium]|nr:D-alanine--D-alanine ligase [Bacillota bacterium]
MKRVGIIFGGRSGEHEVSLLSAASVLKALDREKFIPVKIGITRKGTWLLYDGPEEKIEDGSWETLAKASLAADPEKYGISVVSAGGKGLKDLIDFALPILHGTYGEDGTIQGLLEMADVPYGGCGITGSALAMDKILAKTIFEKLGLPQVPYRAVMAEDLKTPEGEWKEDIFPPLEELGYPLFVKPANLGSSVGISKVRNRDQLKRALAAAAEYDRRIVVEKGLEVRELETALLGNHEVKAAVVGEVISGADFYDYEAKYINGDDAVLQIPAEVPEAISEEIRRIAVDAYKALDCAGFARADFFLEKNTGKIYINEINTIPGFTRFSMFPRLWKGAGLEYSVLIERIVELGYERYHAKNRRKTNL